VGHRIGERIRNATYQIYHSEPNEFGEVDSGDWIAILSLTFQVKYRPVVEVDSVAVECNAGRVK